MTAPSAKGISGVVLVVEDEPDMRQLLAGLLEGDGYPTRTARDGSDALAQLHAGLRPALILLDLVMPGMNGWRFLEERRAVPELADIPVAVVSAYGQSVDAAALGAVATLAKPFDLDGLLDIVAQHCGKRSAIPS